MSQRLFSPQPVSYQGLTSAVPCYSCLWLCVCHTLQRWASKQGASGVRRSTGTFIMALCTPPTCHTHTLDIHFLRNKNSALVPGNRQVTYKWWIWQCCGAAAECCKKNKRVTDTYTPFYENKSGTLNKRRVLHIWQTGHQQKLDISAAPTHVFAKAAVILITCQSSRLPLWNRRKIKETEHLTLVLKCCGLYTYCTSFLWSIFFSCFQTTNSWKKTQNLLHSVAWLQSI